MNALMPDYFNLGLGDAAGEDFTSQVAAQNQQLGLLDPVNQAQAPIAGGDLSVGNSAGAVAPNALSNPTPPLTSAASLPAGLSTPVTQGTTSTASLPSGLSTPNSMSLTAAAAPAANTIAPAIANAATLPAATLANDAIAPVTAAYSDPNYPGNLSGGIAPYASGGSMSGIAAPPGGANTISNSGSFSDAAYEASGHPPSWYRVGAKTWQDVRDSMSLVAGGVNSAGQTQDDLNLISQAAEWAATGGAAAHPYGVGQAQPSHANEPGYKQLPGGRWVPI